LQSNENGDKKTEQTKKLAATPQLTNENPQKQENESTSFPSSPLQRL